MGDSSKTENTSYNQFTKKIEDVTKQESAASSQYGTQNVTGTGSALQTGTGTQTGSQGYLAEARPAIGGILAQIQGQLGQTGLSDAQTAAINTMLTNSGGIPNWQPQAVDLTNKFLTGDPTGLLNPALKSYQDILGPVANADLDPMKTPGLQNYLRTVQDDIINQIRGQFAGAGRDFSGLEQQAIGRGVTQGLAPTIFGQYNQNVQNRTNAANALFGGANTVAGAMTGNYGAVPGVSDYATNAGNYGAQAALNAEALRKGLPLQTLQQLQGLAVPIAGLGAETTQATNQAQQTQTQEQKDTESQVLLNAITNMLAHSTGTANTSGNQTTTTTNSPSLLETLLGGAKLATSLFGTGAGGGLFGR